MCGLIGHLGNKNNKVNIDKLNILGILNETRGTDSCGISMDGSVLKGIGSLKVYRDFAAYYSLKQPEYSSGVIGHTRKSTFGAHTLENAHPFGFGSIKPKNAKKSIFEFVGVHNGTLINHVQIAETGDISLKKTVNEVYEVTENGVKKTKKREIEVNKIDSEVLLERLYKDKNFSVLSEYNGAAALIWQDLNHPEKMFFYHGKSAETNDSEELKEERPLYFWKENKNSLYVSSILDSLYIIGGDDKNIGEFEHNVVYEVTNGDISKAKKTKIDRSKNYITKVAVPINRSHSNIGFQRPHSNATSIANYRERVNARLGKRFYQSKAIKNLTNAQQIRLDLELPIDKGLLCENFDINPNKNKGLTVCKKLRHYRNGHLADGVFCFIPGNGFMFLGPNQKSAIYEMKKLGGKYFYEKQFLDEKPEGDLVFGFKADYFIPFSESAVQANPLNFLHYMFEGIRMKTYSDWRAANANKMSDKNKFDVVSLSIAAAHPIIDINDTTTRKPGVYVNGVLADGSFSFLGSRKIYKFSHGQVKDISYIRGLEPEEYKEEETYTTFEDASKFLEESIKVNGYANLKEKELLKELVSLDEVIEALQRSGQKVKIMSEETEDFINRSLVSAFAEDEIDYKKLREKLWRYALASTKADLACKTLKKLIELNG